MLTLVGKEGATLDLTGMLQVDDMIQEMRYREGCI